jgi:hypothetical protein
MMLVYPLSSRTRRFSLSLGKVKAAAANQDLPALARKRVFLPNPYTILLQKIALLGLRRKSK